MGEGHFGLVYRARRISAGVGKEFVAIKTLKVRTTNTDDMKNEISIMQKLQHPSIVSLLHVIDMSSSGSYELGSDRRLFMIMEFLPDGSMKDYFNNNVRRLPNRLLLEFADQIASGMHYLQSQSIGE